MPFLNNPTLDALTEPSALDNFVYLSGHIRCCYGDKVHGGSPELLHLLITRIGGGGTAVCDRYRGIRISDQCRHLDPCQQLLGTHAA